MKSFRDLIKEVAQPESEEEFNFKNLVHNVRVFDIPRPEYHVPGVLPFTSHDRLADNDAIEDEESYDFSYEKKRDEPTFLGSRNPTYTSDDIYELTDAQEKKKEEIVKAMKKDKKALEDKYGDDWKSVMYATATKKAKELVEATPKRSKKQYTKLHVAGYNFIRTKDGIDIYKTRDGKTIEREEDSEGNAVYRCRLKDGEVIQFNDANDAIQCHREYEYNANSFVESYKKPIYWQVVGMDNKDGQRFTSNEKYQNERDAEKTISKIENTKTKRGRKRFSNLVAVPVYESARSFTYKAAKAKKNDRDEFRFSGETFPVTIDGDDAEEIVSESISAGRMKQNSGETVKVSVSDAKVLNDFLEELDDSTRKQFEKDMRRDAESFETVLEFAKNA